MLLLCRKSLRGRIAIVRSAAPFATSSTGTSSTTPPQSCDKQDDAVAGRVVDPEEDKQHYAPQGQGQDPADPGPSLLKPGVVGDNPEHERVTFVEDKITGEKLRDTDVLADRRSG